MSRVVITLVQLRCDPELMNEKRYYERLQIMHQVWPTLSVEDKARWQGLHDDLLWPLEVKKMAEEATEKQPNCYRLLS